ncbi:papain like protease [Algoriphagus ratkowskyi]|uniref:Papain like protease n=1 Tax=Algoriphagus ratkowskyi TaxID=57028 RepID=A0A2W7QYD6_9BACT|nr:C1 family peptidase [Algoriphagus ratkowskyi]PZX52126.1 papain like protease [Algoriphagus ratkowskyi]TXD76111.1 hypothetical protein ESW18_17740 [Algoriphagus ratkowskyi]
MRVPLLNLFISKELVTLFKSVDSYFISRVSQSFYFENKIFVKSGEDFHFGNSNTQDGISKDEFYEKFMEFYASKVNIDSNVNFLHINVFLSLVDREASKSLKVLLDCISDFRETYHLDVRLLVYSLGENFNSIRNTDRVSIEEQLKIQSLNSEKIISLKENTSFISVFIENKNLSGLNIEFSSDDLVRLVYETSCRLAYNYSDIVNLLSTEKIFSFGCSSYYYEVEELREHLEKLACLYVFESAGVQTDEKADNVKVGRIVEQICTENADLYPAFLSWAKSNNLDATQNQTTNVSKFIKYKKSILLEFLKTPQLSIIEKKAIFIQLLGEDNESIVGYNFDNYERFTILDIEYLTAKFFINELNEPISIEEIKVVRQEIQNNKSYKAQKESELKELVRHISKNSTSLDNQFGLKKIIFKSKKFGLSSKAVPLIDDSLFLEFGARDGISIRNNLDFSSYIDDFSEDSISSNEVICFGYLYSYYLKRIGDSQKLSLPYLHFHLESQYGRKEEYSLIEIINVLITAGFSKSQYYLDVEEDPSAEATEDALSRKLDNIKVLKPEQHLFLNALNQGHPIYSKIRVFDSFSSHFEHSHGVVQFPSQSDIESSNEHFHPIILCGYTKYDEKYIYIAKSPWGKEFGSKGFIFLSEDYLFSGSFLDESFIIGNIIGMDTSLKHSVDFESLSFNLQDDTSMASLVTSAINFSQFQILKLEIVYRVKMDKYSQEIQRLLIPANRYSITQQIARKLSDKISHLENQLSSVKKEYEDAKLRNQERLRKKSLYTWLAVGLGVLALIFVTLFIVMAFTFIPGIVSGVSALIFLYYLINLDPAEELQELLNRIRTIEEEVASLRIKLADIFIEGELRGYLLDGFHTLKSNLKDKFHLLSDLIDHIDQDFLDLKLYEDKILNQSGPYQSLIDFSFLRNSISPRIADSYTNVKLFDLLDLHLVESVLEARSNMVANIVKKNESDFQNILSGFKLNEYLFGTKNYTHLPNPKSLDFYANRLQRYSKPFIFMNSSVGSNNNLVSRLCFLPQKVDNDNDLNRDIRNHFDFPPLFMEFGNNFQSIAHFQLIEIPLLSNLVIASQTKRLFGDDISI